MSKRNKTIFITSYHSFVSKNILNTDTLRILKGSGARIFIIVPSHKVDFFEEVYADEQVGIIGLSGAYLNRGWLKFFSRLSKLMVDSHYLWYKKRERLDETGGLRGILKYGFEVAATKVLKHLNFLNPLIRLLFLKLAHVDELARHFDVHNPSHVFATDIFDETDVLVAAEARRRGIRLIGMVRSWDNCYSKGLMRVVPDKLIVNNETIAAEAVSIHGVKQSDVLVLGSPQYDTFKTGRRASRENFCREVGLSPDLPYILFAPAGNILSDTDDQIVDMLLKARAEGSIPASMQILIRNHPGHPADLDRFVGVDGVVVENPGKRFAANNPKDAELTRNDNEHLANSLYHAEIVIWVATTLGMDAVVFDKPQIVINFDGYKDKPYSQSVRRYHNEDHMKKMLALGGVMTVKSQNELVSSINRYLEDPSLDRGGREKVIQQQFYKLDGQAGRRIGEFLVSELAKA